jgi:predicted ArsR family transcriptional regulator
MKEQIYEILSKNGPMTRTELCEELVGHPTKRRTSIYDHLIKLMLEDRVVSYPKMSGKQGRPNVLFKAL